MIPVATIFSKQRVSVYYSYSEFLEAIECIQKHKDESLKTELLSVVSKTELVVSKTLETIKNCIIKQLKSK